MSFYFGAYPQVIPLDTAVHTGKLANGFTYYIRHNEEPENRVCLYLVNKVGSVLEDGDQQGLAHFMEHMNFNGTTHYPKNELVNYLQKSGVRFGADLNAYTGFDETVYQLPVPTDDASVLENGFQIMRDWARDATLDSIEIDRERGVVLEEERLGRGAQERMQRQYLPVLLNQSRYAQRLPIGKVDILNNFSYSAIRKFHSDWYRPDLQSLVVVGDIDVEKTEALIKSLFSDLKNPATERPRTKYRAELTGANHFLVVTDREMPQTILQVIIKHRDEKMVTEENYIHSMQRQLFNQMLAGRLAALAQTPGLPFMEAEAGISGLEGGLDDFTLWVSLKQAKYKEGFQAAWELIEKLKQFGFTETELARAKQNYISAMEAAFKEKARTNSERFVGEYQRLFLNQEASPGISWEYRFVKNNADAITLTQVNALVPEYIRGTDRDILILAPEKDRAALPDSATLIRWIQETGSKTLSAFTDETDSQVLLSEKLPAGKTMAGKHIEKIGVTELTLSNGACVILKPSDFKNDEIRFAAFSPGGSSLYADSEFQNAAHADLLAQFGVGNFDPVRLGKILTGKMVKVSPYIRERSEGIEGLATPKDLETALQLVYLRFTAPRKDETLFNNIISNSREIIANRYSDPENVFADTVNAVLGNYNYRRSAPTLEKLNQLDLEKIYRAYQDRFADASGFSFIFVGSFSVDSIRPLLERYIGSLPYLDKSEEARDLGIRIPSGRLTKKVYKGTENKAKVKMVFSGGYHFSAETNMQLSALKEVLLIKITQHLREDEGKVYSPSVQIGFSKFPAATYALTVVFGCAPRNADHLMDRVEKEIKTLQQNGPAAEDIEKFKAEYKRVHELQLRSNEYWLSYLGNQLENREDLLQVNDYSQRLEKVNRKTVQEAAKKYLNGHNEIRFELLPEGQ